MQIADYDYNDFNKQRAREADKNLLVKFFYKTVQDKRETVAQGRPIFKEVLYCDIKIPGSRNEGVCEPANQRHFDRFPEHYHAFMKRTGDAPQTVGMPLSEWPLITRAQVEELAYYNVRSVEALATLADSHSHSIMGINVLKQKANEWLAKTQGVNAEVDTLKAQVAELTAKLNEVMTAKPRKPRVTSKAKPKANGAINAGAADAHS